MRTLCFKWLITALLLFTLLSSTEVKPRVLIIGDSISLGYTPFVTKSLAKEAEVFHNPGNAEHSGTGLAKIDQWIGDEKWDIIQFNWGLWDLCYRHPDSKVQGKRDKKNGEITYTITEYAANLDSIVTRIRSQTNAKLIFVTTTYVPEQEAGRFKNDASRYNEVAKEIMERHDVMVNDIYTASISIHKKYGKGRDDVHYSTPGYKALGALVSNFLKAFLEIN